ncbi:hypothetical protein [Bythopirellula goksoeyrii]|uniref:Uncharacterized protein n=1 Tax=Bythopirellula goksoeyrii TaxID=1400387 RepID=A0A5B9QDT5_9BACT|nr:hypothetical protein [Bythopirellula goksoeyrii]QEG35959.1 hypothetical protein Pr1d_32680 [Bythopirellula goksoeyrii]
MNRPITKKQTLQRLRARVCIAACGVLVEICLVAVSVVAEEAPSQGTAAQQDQRLEQMKSQSPKATLTILPVRVAGRSLDRVSELIGLLLEKQGLKNIELGGKPFDSGEASELQQLTQELGKFIQQNPITTDYALYVEYNVKLPQGELQGIRSVFVDKQGEVVWSEVLTTENEALKKLQAHRDLMTLSSEVVERLAPQLGLNEQTAAAAQPGKMARLMDERSGLPPQAERDAMPSREEHFRQAGPNRTLQVVTPRVLGRATDVASAQALANGLNTAALCQAQPAAEVVKFTASQKDPNELKVLWDLAREVRDYVRQHPPETDYVLCADYVFNPQNWEQGIVHFVVCDRQGEWVLVDMQNSHHKDYQAVRPTSQADCDRLLVKRMEERLKVASEQ